MFTPHRLRPWLRAITADPESGSAGGDSGTPPEGATPGGEKDHAGNDSGQDPPTGPEGGETGGKSGDSGDQGDKSGESGQGDGDPDALATVTAENAELKEKLAELERAQMTEQEKKDADAAAVLKRAEEAEAKVAEFQRQKLVADAASQAKLPASMADRLRGDTAEELLADAKKLSASLGYDRSAADPSQGRGGDSQGRGHATLNDAVNAHYAVTGR